MEDMLYPMHMRGGFGDVIVRKSDQFGGVSIEKTSKISPPDFKINSVVEFQEGGTGFLIHKFDNLEIESRQILGIMITAAHVIINLKTLQPKLDEFEVTFIDKSRAFAYLLKEYTKSHSEPLFSETNGNEYCLPGDVAIMLLISSSKIEFEVQNLSENFNINDQCYIAGYPRRPEDLSYALPGVPKSSELERTVLDIFHGFKSLIFSPGRVKNKNKLFIDIDCSSTNGMSGSPLISNGKVIGVYVGGPPLPCQKLLMDFSYAIINERIKEASQILDKIICFRTFYMDSLIDEEYFFLYLALYKILNPKIFEEKTQVEEKKYLEKEKINPMNTARVLQKFNSQKSKIFHHAFDAIYEIVTLFPGPLTHNSSISVEHPIFLEIISFLGGLDGSLGGFLTIQDLIENLITRLS